MSFQNKIKYYLHKILEKLCLTNVISHYESMQTNQCNFRMITLLFFYLLQPLIFHQKCADTLLLVII